MGVGPCAPPPLWPDPPPTLLPPPVLEGGADFPPLPPVLGVAERGPCEDAPEREGDAGVPTPDLGTAELVIGVGTRDIGYLVCRIESLNHRIIESLFLMLG